MFNSCVFLILISAGFSAGFDFTLTHDGPIIIGNTIHFKAEVYDFYYNKFNYEWSDNAKNKPHSYKVTGDNKSQWNVTYPREDYEPGKYEVDLNICEINIIQINWPCVKKSVTFEITADLNGHIEILQNNTVQKKPYISTSTEVEHKVVLIDSDQRYLTENNFTVLTFWLINCTFLGITSDMTLRYNYTSPDEDVTIKAILVAAKLNETTNATTVFPDAPWSNGTTKALNNTIETNGTLLNGTIENGKVLNSTISVTKALNTSANDIKALNSTAEAIKSLNGTINILKALNSTNIKPEAHNSTYADKIMNVTIADTQILVTAIGNGKVLDIPFKKDSYFTPWPDGSCNGSFIPKDPDKLYGYYHHVVKPRNPIQILKVAGNNWLQNGDLLNYTVTFSGSQPYHHCIQFIVGEHKTTGNETCQHTQKTTVNKINVIHYFGSGDKHTVLFIISNAVSKTVTPVVVTNYIAKKHPQLSVIIVPITFIAIAIILIVFGVAFYIQSINRGPIEVADFDFSANNDTEYKSFKGRLVEALSTAFTRSNLEEEPEEGPTWSPSRNAPNKPRIFINVSDSE